MCLVWIGFWFQMYLGSSQGKFDRGFKYGGCGLRFPWICCLCYVGFAVELVWDFRCGVCFNMGRICCMYFGGCSGGGGGGGYGWICWDKSLSMCELN